MASSCSSIFPSLTSSRQPFLHSHSSSIIFLTHPFSLRPSTKPLLKAGPVVRSQTLDFSGSFFEGGFGGTREDDEPTLDFSGSFFEGGFGGTGEDDEPPPTSPWSSFSAVEDKEEPQCPPGLRQYETMAVLRPDMSEDERLALIQKYEELLVAGGGMYIEVFNRGIIPLAYSIRKKNKDGETNTYLDGIYLLFTYFTKPESIAVLEATLLADDDAIRSTSFKIRKRKYTSFD